MGLKKSWVIWDLVWNYTISKRNMNHKKLKNKMDEWIINLSTGFISQSNIYAMAENNNSFTFIRNCLCIANSKGKIRSFWRKLWLHVFGHKFFVRKPFELRRKGLKIWPSCSYTTRLNPFRGDFRGVQPDPTYCWLHWTRWPPGPWAWPSSSSSS